MNQPSETKGPTMTNLGIDFMRDCYAIDTATAGPCSRFRAAVTTPALSSTAGPV